MDPFGCPSIIGKGIRTMREPTLFESHTAWSQGAVQIIDRDLSRPTEHKLRISRHTLAYRCRGCDPGSLVLNGKEIGRSPKQSNDLFFVPAENMLEGVAVGRHKYMVMYLEPTFFDIACDGRSKADVIRPAFSIEDPVLLTLAANMIRECEEGYPSGKLFMETAASLVVQRLMGYLPKMRGIFPPRRLMKVFEFIEDNYREEISLADLAALANLTPAYVCTAFKKATGQSPHQYVIERRVARAVELLKHTAWPIAEIAFASGFSSQSHLTTHFRRQIGTTPAKFRLTFSHFA